jgi:hypothetical protein
MKLQGKILLFLVVAASPNATPASAQIVNTLRGFDDNEMGWSGGIECAVAIADGNTNYFELELLGSVQHQGDRNRWRLLGRSIRRTASGVEIAETQLAHLRHNYRLWSRVSSIAFLQGQYDPFKRLASRFLAGAGARFDIATGVRWHTAAGAAVMLENEELTGDVQQTTNDMRGSFFLTLVRDVSEGVDIDLVGFYQPRLDDPSDARANVIAILRADVIAELYAFVRYVAEYDSAPPAGVEDLDQNLRAGLGYDF